MVCSVYCTVTSSDHWGELVLDFLIRQTGDAAGARVILPFTAGVTYLCCNTADQPQQDMLRHILYTVNSLDIGIFKLFYPHHKCLRLQRQVSLNKMLTIN